MLFAIICIISRSSNLGDPFGPSKISLWKCLRRFHGQSDNTPLLHAHWLQRRMVCWARPRYSRSSHQPSSMPQLGSVSDPDSVLSGWFGLVLLVAGGDGISELSLSGLKLCF